MDASKIKFGKVAYNFSCYFRTSKYLICLVHVAIMDVLPLSRCR